MCICTLLHALSLAKAKLGKLPAKLYIQSDNGSENKNRALLFMCCILVHLGAFKSVEWHMLIPGHTHEDTDAWFSVVSRWLMHVYIFTLSELCTR